MYIPHGAGFNEPTGGWVSAYPNSTVKETVMSVLTIHAQAKVEEAAWTQTMRVNSMSLAEVKEELDLMSNNSGNISTDALLKEYKDHMVLLLNRKWELEGVRGVVFISL